MNELKDNVPNSHPEWPLDLSSKESQQFCRDMALRGVEEMFEALQHLKNWKPHRVTEVTEFNRDEFLEEIVDAFNYFFSLVILTGFDSKDLFDAYMKKDEIIRNRIKNEY
jgi:predicted house-cleaning noncanonical NTP pyrophosphatase (MazG superfamily)